MCPWVIMLLSTGCAWGSNGCKKGSGVQMAALKGVCAFVLQISRNTTQFTGESRSYMAVTG